LTILAKESSPASRSQRIFRYLLRRAKYLVTGADHIHAVRRRMEALGRLQPISPGVTVSPEKDCCIRAEWVVPDGVDRERVLLYIHGGAFIACSAATHRPLVARLALASRTPALSICYRLAPEHPFPAALEDCLAAYRWLLASGIPPSAIVIGGDSAGGNLTLTTLLALRDSGDPLPAGAFCLSPVTDMVSTGGSRLTKLKSDPIFGDLADAGRLVEPYWQGQDPRNPLISPMYADLRGLPPLLFHVGEDEILLDDSVLFVERARAAGVDARVVVWPGMWHVFQAFFMFVPEAQESINQVGEFIQKVLSENQNVGRVCDPTQ
jgi:acetyl esterase/lipase